MATQQRYEQAVAAIQDALARGYRLTGSIRVHWPDLEPAIRARLVSIGDLAQAIGANPGSIRTIIKRLRREQRFGDGTATIHREAGYTPAVQPPQADGTREGRRETRARRKAREQGIEFD